MPEIRITADDHGPIFDGRAGRAAQQFLEAAVREVSQVGKDMVDAQLPRVLRNPTGYYQSRIRRDMASPTNARIHDSRVIYGPWLEGVGSRNKTTRFKGYFTFRLVRQQLAAKAPGIAETVLPPYLREMG